MSKKYYACVYGGASSRIDNELILEVEKLGKIIGESGFSLVYGAGASGCMGAAARGVRSGGGDVMGISPYFIENFEPIFDCDNTVMVDTMAERKMLMEKHADIFFIAPGGIGTMDEFFQVLTLKYLKRNTAPVVVLNINGFYDRLIDLIDSLVEQRAATDVVTGFFEVVDSVDDDRIKRILSEIKGK